MAMIGTDSLGCEQTQGRAMNITGKSVRSCAMRGTESASRAVFHHSGCSNMKISLEDSNEMVFDKEGAIEFIIILMQGFNIKQKTKTINVFE